MVLCSNFPLQVSQCPPDLLSCGPSLLPWPPCICAHALTCTRICPPWSPCGFKVLILIRFELTYCQSSFSCSSETTGSCHQDWDLGYKPVGRLVPTGSCGIKMRSSFPALSSQSGSQQVSCSAEDHLKRECVAQGAQQHWE